MFCVYVGTASSIHSSWTCVLFSFSWLLCAHVEGKRGTMYSRYSPTALVITLGTGPTFTFLANGTILLYVCSLLVYCGLEWWIYIYACMHVRICAYVCLYNCSDIRTYIHYRGALLWLWALCMDAPDCYASLIIGMHFSLALLITKLCMYVCVYT